MYTYNGFNPENNKKLEKVLTEALDAIEFARANADQFPEYEVIDAQGQVIDSHHILKNETDAIINSLM